MSQSRRSPSSKNQSYLPFLIKQMETMSRSHKQSATISEQHWKSTFDFSEIVNNYGLKRGTVWQILRFISQFSLKLYIQFWKYFDSMILGRLGKGYCKKIGCWNFWLGCLSTFKLSNSEEMLIISRGFIFAVDRFVMFISSMIIARKSKFLLNWGRWTNWIGIIRLCS